MNKTSQTKFNSHVMELAAKHQQKLQREVGTNWWYHKSKTSWALTLLSEIGFYFTLVINLIIMSSYSMILSMNSEKSNWDLERALVKNALSAFLVGTLFVLVGYVLKKISGHRRKCGEYNQNLLLLISMIGFAMGCILLFVTAYDVLVTANIDNMYAEAVESSTPFKIYAELICLHILPLLMMLVPAILFFVMSRCDFKEKKEIYERMTETLYKDFVKENPNYSIDEWEACLNSFSGYKAEDQKENTD